MRILHSALRNTSPARRVLVDESGAAMVEFALVAPLLILLVFATLYFTLAIANYAALTLAAGTGAQVLTTERLSASSSSWTPYTDTVNAIKNSASLLQGSSIGIILSVNGVGCTTNATCQTALTGVSNTTTPAAVTLTYPCDPMLLSTTFTVLWINYGSCTFTTTITGVVQ
jgi:Flp pilus assembly protein TadG